MRKDKQNSSVKSPDLVERASDTETAEKLRDELRTVYDSRTMARELLSEPKAPGKRQGANQGLEIHR